jgi:hypothetical protein
VPRGAAQARSWVFEWLVLQSGFRDSDQRPIAYQGCSIRRDEVSHLTSFPDMTV